MHSGGTYGFLPLYLIVAPNLVRVWQNTLQVHQNPKTHPYLCIYRCLKTKAHQGTNITTLHYHPNNRSPTCPNTPLAGLCCAFTTGTGIACADFWGTGAGALRNAATDGASLIGVPTVATPSTTIAFPSACTCEVGICTRGGEVDTVKSGPRGS